MSFFRMTEVKAARKRRECEDCGGAIEVGEPYRAYCQHQDGELFYGGAHGDCMDWANRVMNTEEGRATIEQGDPEDEDQEDLADAIRSFPPSDTVYRRLPARWKAVVDKYREAPRLI